MLLLLQQFRDTRDLAPPLPTRQTQMGGDDPDRDASNLHESVYRATGLEGLDRKVDEPGFEYAPLHHQGVAELCAAASQVRSRDNRRLQFPFEKCDLLAAFDGIAADFLNGDDIRVDFL